MQAKRIAINGQNCSRRVYHSVNDTWPMRHHLDLPIVTHRRNAPGLISPNNLTVMGFFLSVPSLQPLGFATFQCAEGAKRFGAKRFGARCIWGPKRHPINAVLLCEGRNWKRGRTWTNNRNKMGVSMQGIISGILQRMKSGTHSIISARVY